jgi:hypothetical protein
MEFGRFQKHFESAAIRLAFLPRGGLLFNEESFSQNSRFSGNAKNAVSL